MIEVATDTSTAWISTVLEVMFAKFPAACSGDVLSSYVMCVNSNTLLKRRVVHICVCKSMNLYSNLYFPIAIIYWSMMGTQVLTCIVLYEAQFNFL